MPDALDALPAPPCPACREGNTVFAFERFGVRTFMCPDCEHSWDVLFPSSSSIDGAITRPGAPAVGPDRDTPRGVRRRQREDDRDS